MADTDDLNVKSPWKTPVAAEEAPVNGMAAESWPALADAQAQAHRSKTPDLPAPQVAHINALYFVNLIMLVYISLFKQHNTLRGYK